MNLAKTGAFISAMRKQNGLTQAELAKRLGVTDKAVSRWETGRGFPDVSILLALSEALNVSVLELLVGEPCDSGKDDGRMKTQKENKAIVDALSYTKQTGKKALLVLGIILGACLLVSPLFLSGFGIWVSALPVAGLVLLVVSIVIMRRGKKRAAVAVEGATERGSGQTVERGSEETVEHGSGQTVGRGSGQTIERGSEETTLRDVEIAQRDMETEKQDTEIANRDKGKTTRQKWLAYLAYIIAILATVAALATAAHPEGVSLRFADGPDNTLIVKVSYYDLLSVGYAYPLPMLTVLLTAAATLLAIICVIGRLRLKRLQNAVFTLTIIAFAFAMLVTILPAVFAAMAPSIPNVAVSALLLVSLAAQAISNSRRSVSKGAA